MLRKLLCIVVVIMMVLTIVGCAAPEKDEAGEPVNVESGQGEAPEEVPEGEQTVIRFVSQMTNGEDVPFIEQFMAENPDIKVIHEAIDFSEYDKMLKVRFMTDDSPDVFTVISTMYSKYANEGYLMDVTNAAGMETLTENDSFKDAYTIDGKIYGFPVEMQGGPIPIYYNKVYFEEKGFTPPETLDELWALCDAIKADGVDPMVIAGQDQWSLEYFFRFRQYSGILEEHPQWMEDVYEGRLLPSEVYRKEFEMFEDMINNGYLSKASLSLTWPQSVPYFIEGNAALFPQGPWVPSLPEIAEADPEKFQLGCFTSPVDPGPDGKINATTEVDMTLVVSADSKNKEAAMRLYEWFVKKDTLKSYLEAKSSMTFLDVDYKVDPVIQEHVNNICSDKYKLIPSQNVTLAPAFMMDANWNAFQNVLAGSPVETELEKLDEEFLKTKDAAVINK